MKTMSKRAWVLYVFIAAFLAGLIVLFYTFYTNADSWAMKKANRHLYSSGTLSVAGSIKDETGAVLAETKDGKRVYNSDKTVRTATMHTVGDSEGYIATGVQTSYKDVITGYNFVDGIYNLKKYGKGNDVNLTITHSSVRRHTAPSEATKARSAFIITKRVSFYALYQARLMILQISPSQV